ncbi:MAG: hypothetical protein JNK33_02710 [Candidatus Doudnabacteria bacterium]|nr:hypothetical protein [Candidatus Doudnabacteria bacterium]
MKTKTHIVSLQGQDFVISAAAEPALLDHLKQLQHATRFRPGVYRQNVEGLRDVLLTGGSKPVSKKRFSEAIELVGLPEPRRPFEPITQHFPGLALKSSRVWHTIRYRSGSSWWQTLLIVVSVAAVLLAVSAGFTAVWLLLAGHQPQEGWSVVQTSIGPVRSWMVQPQAMPAWPLNWMSYIVYCLLFLLVAVAAWRLRQKKHRFVYGLVLLSSVVFALLLQNTQSTNLTIPPESKVITGSAAAPLRSKIAYLQQCGDEIPYVFDGQTNGMLFRQLRDDGFQLVEPLKTRVSDGSIDTTELCTAYDRLRRDHPKQNIVLQLYTTTADDTLRPYEFSDIGNSQVTSSYGLFAKG